MSYLGTIDWVHENQGRMRWKDKMRTLLDAVLIQASHSLQTSPHLKVRISNPTKISIPDSDISKHAVALCRDAGEEWIFYHSMRAYVWARLLTDSSRKFDDEALFVALMLHDMGLAKKHSLPPGELGCFTQVGAQMAHELGQQHHWSQDRVHLTANAITLHLNVIVHDRHGIEAQMVRTGTGADVIGSRIDELPTSVVEDTLRDYPRVNFKGNLMMAFEEELMHRPCCRISFMQKYLGFKKRVHHSCFAD